MVSPYICTDDLTLGHKILKFWLAHSPRESLDPTIYSYRRCDSLGKTNRSLAAGTAINPTRRTGEVCSV